MTVTSLQKEFDEMKSRVSHLEKVLILGEGDRLPLAEIVRSLTKTVSDYIAQKDKEEQISREKAEQQAKEKKAEWNRLKWLIIGIVLPGIFIFVGQAFVFYVKIFPLIDELSK